MSQSAFGIVGQDLIINCFQKIFGLLIKSILSMFFFTLPKESFMKTHVNWSPTWNKNTELEFKKVYITSTNNIKLCLLFMKL